MSEESLKSISNKIELQKTAKSYLSKAMALALTYGFTMSAGAGVLLWVAQNSPFLGLLTGIGLGKLAQKQFEGTVNSYSNYMDT